MRPLIDLSSTAAKYWINVLETKLHLFLLHPTFALIVASAKAEAAAV